MSQGKLVEIRSGLRVRDQATRREGMVIPPPRGQSVELGRTWVDLGGGPEQVEDRLLDPVLQHVRLTVRHNVQDPTDDLREVAEVRRDLQAHSPVEVDPDNPQCRTRRDANKNAYFEFATEFPDEVRRVLREFGHEARVVMEIVQPDIGLECVKCGTFAGFVATCPRCGFRDIARCPNCDEDVPREKYELVSGDLFICPHCRRRVRLRINPNLVRDDGTYNEPVVLVEDAQG